MVRIVSQNFSPPRSRHSSGETDWDLAERADSALSALGKKREFFGFSEYESSSDSFWDSEIDFEHSEESIVMARFLHDDINGNGLAEKSDLTIKRKERRRERNKISAQEYRKRKRQITNSKQQELSILEDKNKCLLELVNRLERKTERAKMYLRGLTVPSPLIAHNKTETTANDINNTPNLTLLTSENASDYSNFKQSQQLNMNVNKNLQNSAANLCPTVKSPSEGDGFRISWDSIDLPNVKTSYVLLNSNSCAGANNNGNRGNHSTQIAFSSLVPVKSKHTGSYYNSNMNFKSPILRPSSLQTVPEIPATLLGDIDCNTTCTSATIPVQSMETFQVELSFTKNNDETLPLDSMNISLNNNVNLNNNNITNNTNSQLKDNVKCDNHVEINSFQHLNINGNLNQKVIVSNSKQEQVYQ